MGETIVWIDPDGASTTLHTPTSTAKFVAWNVSGRFAPPARVEEEGIPDHDGMRLRTVLHDAREIVLPVWVQAGTDADLRTQVRALVAAMNPKRGDGLLRVTSPLGDQRELVCRAVAGLEGSERIGDTSGPLAQLLAIVFRAWEPYWQDTTDTAAGPWQIGTAPGSFFPIFPIRLSSSEIFAADTVTNAGDVEAWPVWTIVGPGSSITLRNLTTGKLLTLATTLAAGSSVVIDTRFGKKTVTRSDGANLYGSLSSASSFWPLQPGANSVQIEMSGATAGVSSVSLLRRHRYLGV